MERPERKPNRLRRYDYSQNGAYFITMCTYDRQNIFGTFPVGAIHESPDNFKLSKNGEIARSMIESLPNRFPEIQLDQYVIMPNHIHILVSIDRERAIHESPLRGKRSIISNIVGYLKMNISKRIHMSNHGIIEIWQRSYHDHIVRNQEEYKEIRKYIDENIVKWQDDRYYIKTSDQRFEGNLP